MSLAPCPLGLDLVPLIMTSVEEPRPSQRRFWDARAIASWLFLFVVVAVVAFLLVRHTRGGSLWWHHVFGHGVSAAIRSYAWVGLVGLIVVAVCVYISADHRRVARINYRNGAGIGLGTFDEWLRAKRQVEEEATGDPKALKRAEKDKQHEKKLYEELGRSISRHEKKHPPRGREQQVLRRNKRTGT